MENQNPKHIAIILDGNRRYAKKLALEPWKGHEQGAEIIEKLFDWLKELGIKQLTLYCLSTENLKRDKKEVDYLLDLFRKEFNKLQKPEEIKKLEKDKVKIRFIGNLDLLPKDLKEKCENLEKQTKNNSNYIINFAIAYGGRQELIQTIKKIIKSKIPIEKINEETIKENLYMSDEPDIIIRTGGVIRTSNFLPFQSVYSEWFFIDKLWPEFEKQDLIKVIEEFKTRKRNFGK